MNTKRTDELHHELKQCESIDTYVQENDEYFLRCTLSEYLQTMIEMRGIKKPEVVKCSGLDAVYAYQIISGVKENPDRDKLLALAFSLRLDALHTNRLLHIGGKSELYPKNRRDSIILFALKKSMTLYEADDLLHQFDEKTIQ